MADPMVDPGLFAIMYSTRSMRRASSRGAGATLTTVHYFFEEELKQKLGVPADMEITALLPLGFPEGRFGPVSRRPVEEVLHWDRWGNREE